MVDELLSELAVAPIEDDFMKLKVRDFWLEASGWKWEQFDCLLPQNVLHKLRALHLVTDE